MPPRPNSRNAPVTRKRGESDPNNPPKKRKTRHSKGGSDSERKAGVDDEVEPRVEKPGRHSKKSRYFFFHCFFLSFFAFFFIFPYGPRPKLLLNHNTVNHIIKCLRTIANYWSSSRIFRSWKLMAQTG